MKRYNIGAKYICTKPYNDIKENESVQLLWVLQDTVQLGHGEGVLTITHADFEEHFSKCTRCGEECPLCST